MINVLFWIGRFAILTHRPWVHEMAKEDHPELFSDMIDEMPFWAARAGVNRIERVTKMLQMGFVSQPEAQAMLGVR
jgi:hypothetical protein